MLIADWVFLILILLFAVLGLFIGFGHGLRFFTKGFFGFIISIFVCYVLGGFLIQIGFIASALASFRSIFEGKGGFYSILLKIRIDIIVYYIVLFIVVQILRAIIVKVISGLFLSKNVIIVFINKIFGLALFIGVLAVLILIGFQIVYLIGGDVAANVTKEITGSKLKIDWLYFNNPLTEIVEILFKLQITKTVPVQG